MRLLPLILAPLLVLTSCAGIGNVGTIATPQRCEDAIAGVSTLQELVKVLIDRGIHPQDLQQVATLLAQGQVTIAEVCSFATHQNDPDPADAPGNTV